MILRVLGKIAHAPAQHGALAAVRLKQSGRPGARHGRSVRSTAAASARQRRDIRTAFGRRGFYFGLRVVSGRRERRRAGLGPRQGEVIAVAAADRPGAAAASLFVGEEPRRAAQRVARLSRPSKAEERAGDYCRAQGRPRGGPTAAGVAGGARAAATAPTTASPPAAARRADTAAVRPPRVGGAAARAAPPAE